MSEAIKDRFGRECFDLNGVKYPVKYFCLDSSRLVYCNYKSRPEMDKAEILYGTSNSCYAEGFGTMPLKQCREELRKVQPYDYTDEAGDVYCGICRTLKILSYVDDNGRFENEFRACRCLEYVEKQITERREECFGKNNVIKNYMFENADMSIEFMRKCEKYANNFGHDSKKQFSLLLFGGVGRGKTYAAACIANRLIDRRFSATFTSVSKFERELWASNDKEYTYNELTKPDLLIIDDLASERDTDYMHEIQFNMLQTRLECGKPMIITTNMTAKQLTTPDDLRMARINSRILENSYALLCEGKDRRLEKFMDNSKIYEQIVSEPLVPAIDSPETKNNSFAAFGDLYSDEDVLF